MRYLLLAAAATALFFAAYWVLMRHEKRHQMVRWYLMGTLVLSLLLPAIHLRLAVPQQHIAGNLPGIFSQASLPGMASTASTASTAATADTGSVSFAQVFLWVWLTGFAVAATLLAVRVLRLRRRMRALPCREEDGIRGGLDLAQGIQLLADMGQLHDVYGCLQRQAADRQVFPCQAQKFQHFLITALHIACKERGFASAHHR